MDAHRTIHLLRQAADALDAAHQARLIHRDIKPQNILVGLGDHAYLADFGLTKPAGSRGMTRTGEFMGSVDYMSPEQIRGRSSTQASDIYAFASVLYEALTGVVPYPMDTDTAVLLAHVEEEPPSVTGTRPELPAELDAVIARAMAKDPAERPKSAAEVIRSAEHALGPLRDEVEPPAKAESVQELGIRTPAAVTRASRPETKQAQKVHVEPEAEDAHVEPEVEEARPRRVKPKPKRAAASTRLSRPLTKASKRAALTRAPMGRPTQVSAERPSHRAPAMRIAAIVLVVAAVAGIVGGILLGVSLGDSSGSGAKERPGGSAASGALALRYPSGWASTEPRAVTGLQLRAALALSASDDQAGDGLVAGFTNATGPTLLPASFRQLLDGDTNERERVRLGKLEGYRYPELGHEDLGDTVRVYVVPTTSGVATIACFAGENGVGALDECEGIAGTLRLKGARAFAVGPDPDYAKLVNSRVTKVSRARDSARARVRTATTAAAVASALRSVVPVYRSAARRLAAREVSPELKPTSLAIATAMAGVGNAYTRLAAAAASQSDARYKKQQRRVRAAEGRLNRTLSALRSLGYSVP